MIRHRIRVRVHGLVQGVGFRPTVCRHAREMDLTGNVRNSPSGIIIEAQGPAHALALFITRILNNPPPQARIKGIDTERIPEEVSESGFSIIASERSGDLTAGMPPDIALCADCLAEIVNPADRRHCYAFTNCTNCGPRFTIIHALPYDRERTSMSDFIMCPECRREYEDPLNRRFDAQPNACPICGPGLFLLDSDGIRIATEDPLGDAALKLKQGLIVAVKGLGGYHLACDATNTDAISLLRQRKRRPDKALAVMCRSVEEASDMCELSPEHVRLLTSSTAPIVVADRRPDCRVPGAISPDTLDIGLLLPYTPLHHLLLDKISPLVMTSGNLADEPLICDEQGLTAILGPVADCALAHNRTIVRRCDDSVAKVVHGKPLFIRRSRGYVPESIPLPFSGPSVLGCGADLKSAFCLTRSDQAFLSQHIGDLSEFGNYSFYSEAIDDLARLLNARPSILAHDLHPDYHSTRFAMQYPNARRLAVQHHHAHIAACMIENGLNEPVIGLAFDGTGLGSDGTFWGGEFLVADLKSLRRVAHFKPYPLPGGDAAVVNPDRMALGCLWTDLGPEKGEETARSVLPSLADEERATLIRLIQQKIRAPLTSSAGRLFDAVSAMLGLCGAVSYEGQAAIRLQTAATESDTVYPFEFDGSLLDFGPMIRAIVKDRLSGVDVGKISAAFHNTLASASVSVCIALRAGIKINRIALSGGVFQNERILGRLSAELSKSGFEVHLHTRLPPNDACIAVGQAGIALAKEEK